MIRLVVPGRRNSLVKLSLIAAVWFPSGLGAQTAIPGLRQIRWPLLDIVILPDSSSGLWFLVAPNPRAEQWTKFKSSVVSVGIDPITALQWATVARTLIADPGNRSTGVRSVLPPLRDSKGPEFVLLAKNPQQAPASESLIFLVSDSSTGTQWKTTASPAELDALLTALEAAARERQATWDPGARASTPIDDSVDVPVEVVFQPTPTFPGKLAFNGREGRVWVTYVIDATGRSATGSIRPLLSDDPLFTQAAIDALMHSKFKPALRGGRPVRQRVFQVIQFRHW